MKNVKKKCSKRIKIIYVFFLIFSTSLFFHLNSCEGKKTDVEEKQQQLLNIDDEKRTLVSHLAGTWYSDNRQQLEAELRMYLKEAEYRGDANICGLILPHAGYMYSGGVAAMGVKQIEGRSFHRVIILGPSHRYYLENNVSVPPFTHYRTPLGEIPLDTVFMEKLKKSFFVKSIREVHENEHSIQIELPFLQTALGEFLLVPVVVGQLNAYAAGEIARLLLSLIDPATLVVASSDFIHYGPDYGYVPFTVDVEKNIKKLDMEACDLICKKDYSGFFSFFDRTGATICGRSPIAILLAMSGETIVPTLLTYDTSGRITGDVHNSVSYACISFSGSWNKSGNPSLEKKDEKLTDKDKSSLLDLARKTLAYYLKNNISPLPKQLGIMVSPGMKIVRGGFVTIHEHGQLRGCIGDIFPQRPIYEVVMNHALNAALHDNRFSPVKKEELDHLEFEISVLTQPEPVPSYESIVVGKHGIVLSKNGHTAVFLPQVAPEQGWNLSQTLTYLAMKAGLPKDAWERGASFLVFEADVFSEQDDHLR
jgi:AmmeMemoRadiSam system protein B/AmmeMemoRadiSam system protein A